MTMVRKLVQRRATLALAAVFALVAAPLARAQEPIEDQGLYRFFQGGVELGRETFR